LLDLFESVGYTNKLTESNVLERVARCTNFTVDLESTSEGSMVKGGKISLVTPGIVRRVHNIFLIEEGDLGGGSCRKAYCTGGKTVLANLQRELEKISQRSSVASKR
jgi:hypothetical protein